MTHHHDPSVTLGETDPAVLAAAWAAVDPDPETRAGTEALLVEGGAALAAAFGRPLAFGTAGLRGSLGPGPRAMNRVLVRVTAAALADCVSGEEDPHVVVGYDARHGSHAFAEDTARVMLARGVRCTLLPRPLPTPVLAFAVRDLDASAGVMVTASHNPRQDNGYKVYWRGGALLVSPRDREIAAAMDSMPLLADTDLAPEPPAVADDGVVDRYLDTVVAALDPDGPRAATIAYTALHGVGAEMVAAAFARAGFAPPHSVPEQAEPDPDFPTAPFPNPEEPGALDLVLALAARTGATVALANDPDADRLAVAVRHGTGWRLLTGDDLGSILAHHLLRRRGGGGLTINTVVSSRLLSRIAAAHGATHRETLTGFKWIMAARAEDEQSDFVIGYEEALGYAVTDAVRDKDGISAALVVAELVAQLEAQDRTLLDLLDEVHELHGVHVNGQRSLRFEAVVDGPPVMTQAMAALRSAPPTDLGGDPVTEVIDLAAGTDTLPPTDGVVLHTAEARVVVRPSGTEPKMKVYAEVVEPVGTSVGDARHAAGTRLRAVIDDAVAVVAAAGEAAMSSPEEDPRVAAVFGSLPSGADRAADLRLVVRCVDLTTLEGDDTPARIRALCARARRPDPADPTVGPVAAVCVYPELAPLVRELVGGSIGVASVAGAFPAGLSGAEVREADIRDAVARGADEVDIVLNRSAFLGGDEARVRAELETARKAAGATRLKVIIEVGELRRVDRIRRATALAIEAGADFVKTSTGKIAVNATPQAVWAMAEEIAAHAGRGEVVGLKIAGGVRSAEDALGYVAIVREVLGEEWLTPARLRFGASSLMNPLIDELHRTEAWGRDG